MRKPTRLTKRKILHRFYDLNIYENGKKLENTEKEEYSYLYEDGQSLIDRNIEVDINDHNFVKNGNELNLKDLAEAFEKVKNDPYERIILTWSDEYDYQNHFRIEGLSLETEKEFNLRVKEYENKKKNNLAKKEKAKIEKQKKLNQKDSILKKLSPEERVLLGFK